MESLAVELFNNDPVVQEKSDMYPFDHETWTAEVSEKVSNSILTSLFQFMEYACYCNKIVKGGGSVPGAQDPNDALCLDLYKCYKCINIDYDHTGK